jgi:16S rRNA (guanine1207-N2)-methyltransferase
MGSDHETHVTGGHYFEPSPGARSARREVRLDLPDLSLVLATDRGVFAADAVDVGTGILLREAGPPSPTGTLVDVGCGYGPIALALASRSPGARVLAVDVNERARSLCRENAARAGLANVEVAAPDEVPDDLVVDEIWSNPPIRIGKAALHDLLLGWLVRLNPGGRALLVVQKHLGADSLAAWLREQGWRVERLAARRAYRVLEVTRA